MRWQHVWGRAAAAMLLTGMQLPNWLAPGSGSLIAEAKWTTRRKHDAREKTRELWYHGYNNYMEHAFPLDELMPLSCTGRGPDWARPQNFATNDVVGNFSLTLLDVLDTLVVLEDRKGFERAVRDAIDWVSFDVNTRPQVFETTIRVLGGLLSGHTFASDHKHPFFLPWYRGELLKMAHDLGERLLRAFITPTGLPYARLNLKHGVAVGETYETCTAGAGSLILEFGTLSRLTGDDRFERAAFKAFFALWNRKSDIGLVGNTINSWTGKWTAPEVSGIGAGMDSFFEYALKWYILSGEVQFLDVWNEAYAAIMRYSRGPDGFWFRTVNMHSGFMAYNTVDSLSAFWPGLQVLAGDVENAIKAHLIYWNLWRRNSGMPEVWDIGHMDMVASQYPLRPEFVESTYYLYRATGDSFYLDVGERILNDLIGRAKVDCGLTGILDLKTNKRDDRMESFVLSETIKYLYLLFDETNPLHKGDSNYIFTTEGHILTLDPKHLRPLAPIQRKLRRLENHQCPAYKPLQVGLSDDQSLHSDAWNTSTGIVTGIRYRSDVDYARSLVGAASLVSDEHWWSPHGHCDVPVTELYSFDFIMSPRGKSVPEDPKPSPLKIKEIDDGFIMQNVSGVRTHIVRRMDGKGYDIVKLGPHAVRRGQIVYVNDTELFSATVLDEAASNGALGLIGKDGRAAQVALRVFIDTESGTADPVLQIQSGLEQNELEVTLMAFTSTFGGDPSVSSRRREPEKTSSVLAFGRGPIGSILTAVLSNPRGCHPYDRRLLERNDGANRVLLVWRGDCTFIQKLTNAAKAGASGIIIISDENDGINPSAEQEDVDLARRELADTSSLSDSKDENAAIDLDDIVAVLVTRSSGEELLRLLRTTEARGFAEVRVVVEPEPQVDTEASAGETARVEKNQEGQKSSSPPEGNKILYLNGHPLINTRILV